MPAAWATAIQRSSERSASVEIAAGDPADEGTLLPPPPSVAAKEQEPGRARSADDEKGQGASGASGGSGGPEESRATADVGAVVEGGDGEAAAEGPLARVRIGGLYHASSAKKVCAARRLAERKSRSHGKPLFRNSRVPIRSPYP